MTLLIARPANVPDSRPWLTLSQLEVFDPGAPRKTRERRFCCPLEACIGKPIDAEHRSLALDQHTGAWHCHRCGGEGQLEDFRAAVGPTTRKQRAYKQAVEALTLHPRASTTEEQRGGMAAAAGRYEEYRDLAGTPGEAYLAGRGIPIDLAHAAGVRYGSASGRMAVIFPIRGRDGELVALNGRFLAVAEGQLKTRSAGPISAGVFATPGALAAHQVAVCEAAIDALTLAAAGLPAVALIGTSNRPTWLRTRLARAQVLLATDADDAGDAAAAALDRWFDAGPSPKRLRPPTAHKDWNGVLQVLGPDGLATLLPPPLGATRVFRGPIDLATTPTPAPEHPDHRAAEAEYQRLYVEICRLNDAARAADDPADRAQLSAEARALTRGPYPDARRKFLLFTDPDLFA